MPSPIRSSLVVLVAACGAPPDNVEACQAFLDALPCGADAVAERLDCAVYESVRTCDISDYFDCLAEQTSCGDTGGDEVDTSGWASCTALATCEASGDAD